VIETFFGFIGYETTLELAYNHMKRGRSVIFTGPAGCGKTSLIASCAEIMSTRRAQSIPMMIEFCNPPKQFVLEMISKLYRRKLLEREMLSQDWETVKKRLSRDHVRHSTKIALQAFHNYPGLFVGIDDLDMITPIGRSIVLSLTDSGAIICGAATKRTATLKRVIYQFQEIPVPPLRDDVARKITEAFVNERGLLVEDRKHFVENVIWKAAGNVLALNNMLRYFENEPRIRTEDVRKISQGAGRKEVSLEWIIYAAFAFIVMLRFVSRATMNKQLYIITSVIAALFIVMRYVLAKGNRSETT
jgi:energy-coupling factor transporter ATP-binding protein EcfA2